MDFPDEVPELRKAEIWRSKAEIEDAARGRM
jgi:hypothetical protein